MNVNEPMNQEVDLGLNVGDLHNELRNTFHWCAFRGDFDPRGPQQKFIRQMLDPFGKRGTEE